MGAGQLFWERLTPGGMIVLDQYNFDVVPLLPQTLGGPIGLPSSQRTSAGSQSQGAPIGLIHQTAY